MPPSTLPEDFLERLKRAQSGDQEARASLVEENLRLVWSIVGRFRARGELEDLFQVGCVGLLRAIDRFDPSFGVQFSTYAVPLIIGEIRRDLRGQGTIKVSRSLKERAGKIAIARERLVGVLGRDPTLEEVAREAECTVDEAIEAMEAQAPVASLEAAGSTEAEGRPLAERVADAGADEGRWLQRLDVRGGMAGLDEIERQVLEMRFFEDLTQEQAARRLGTNQVRISRIERRALIKVKRYLTAEDGGA